MSQRLVWNFEFSTKKNKLGGISTLDPMDNLGLRATECTDSLKWEIRYFWPAHETVSLYLLDEALLDIHLYQQKHKEDCYYLLPHESYNIKFRRGQLLYKPLIKRAGNALAFGSKIPLETNASSSEACSLQVRDLLMQIQQHGKKIQVQKTSFTYKFPTTPSIKLELAKLNVHKRNYFSVCIEGRSQVLVEQIDQNLLEHRAPSDYITFLNQLNPS